MMRWTYKREGAKLATGRILNPEALTLRLWNTASETRVQPLNLMTGRPIWSRKNPATSTILLVRFVGLRWVEGGAYIKTISRNTKNQV